MSNCRRMCHHDVGAPALYAYQRRGLFSFLDAVMLDGYNPRYATNTSRDGRFLTISFADSHGYVNGQLLEISDSSYEPLNGLHRVIKSDVTTQVQIYLKDALYEQYPESTTETTLQTKVAPFGWEKVFESETQRSYRSRSEVSSKIVVTFKVPTYHATQLVTTNAVCYEVDLSKDIDSVTGSTIDSCFTGNIAQVNHTSFYWVTSSNSDNLAGSMNYTNTSVAKAPWTLVGDEKMIYAITCPWAGYDNNENSNDRQFDPNKYWSSYRYPSLYAFGDIECVDPVEYQTGSSFYFRFYYFRNTGSYEGSMTTWYNRSFIRPGSWGWYDYFFSGYDPSGTYQGARTATVNSGYTDSYGTSGSRYLYNAYPQRVTGGITYFDYLAYMSGPNAGANSAGCFYKGTFPYVKYCDTNFLNIGGNSYDQRAFTLPLNNGSKVFFATTNHTGYWANNDGCGHWCFELD